LINEKVIHEAEREKVKKNEANFFVDEVFVVHGKHEGIDFSEYRVNQNLAKNK
jgi:hypothetical protein